ncbi:zinc ribbon domain-containing protein [Amycolatopsis sp. WQ 127309]|nr:zinc ribbon domain-containing protein [Amycolatopsis sp. WQ 127309]UOZ07955.1 zinc ribbon domain-containing protein [Amycolatopsis sp. WQ 127309]
MPVLNSRPPVEAPAPADSGCPGCGTRGPASDRFCAACGQPLGRTVSVAAAPREETRPAAGARGDVLLELLERRGELGPQRVAVAVGGEAMCLACGTDATRGQAACAECGAPMPLGVAVDRPAVLGRFHKHGRRLVRAKFALCVGFAGGGARLLKGNGEFDVVALDELSAAEVPLNSEVDLRGLRGPAAALLWWAARPTAPPGVAWSPAALPAHVRSAYAADLGATRLHALDLLRLDRPDLLGEIGLGEPEATWLSVVHAARRSRFEALVDAAARLPAGRYRRVVAVLSACADGIVGVPGAAQRLAGCLVAFSADEPLAAALERKLGIRKAAHGDVMADEWLRAQRHGLPGTVFAMLDGRPDEETAGLLGPAGRLAAAHGGSLAVVGAPEITVASMTVLDDIIERGAVDAEAVRSAQRPVDELTYLVGRTQPEKLTETELETLGHQDELDRRAFARTGEVPAERRETRLGKHFAAVEAFERSRPQDVTIGDVLAEYRSVAEHLVGLLEESAEAPAGLPEPIVADVSVWSYLVRTYGADRLRAVPGLAARHPRFFEWVSLYAAREHLFLAQWQAGADAARECLRVAVDESVRDEAQNLLACALHNLGDHAGAVRELESALEGEHSPALLANIGVVAPHLDTELAARHLARLVREAPTAAMRTAAAVRALAIWRGEGERVWEGEEAGRELPTVLREPLRSIVAEDIPLADFREISLVLSRFDKAWIRRPESLARSPHAKSLEARYARARAEDDLSAVIDFFASIRNWDQGPDWVRPARDQLIDDVRAVMVEDLDGAAVAGSTAFALATRLSGLSPYDRVSLSVLSACTVSYVLLLDDKEISDAIVDMHKSALELLPGLSDEDRSRIEPFVELATRRVAINIQQARVREIGKIVDPYNQAVDILDVVQRGTTAWFTARGVVAETVELCRATRTQLLPWSRAVEHAETRTDILDFLDQVRDLEFKAQRALGG